MKKKEIKTLGQMLGHFGGTATSKKHGKQHYILMQQKSAAKRKLNNLNNKLTK